ncbi:kremen protein 2 isoform X2 [Crotalus tigris]|uniref:kremen protein 2 isoform X2 n=1 Tax=Crotalus tigris TaxID=88082 RepID=UPI00192F524E|nr:kremen protein 2 isoform X2 [Crotalus tigris]
MPWEVIGFLLVLLQRSWTLQKAELSECFMVNGADYRGLQNRTAPGSAGKPCLYWNQTREHAYNTAKYPNGEWGLGSHNYCRNPDGDVQPWCYISENEEGIYWKYCDIPTCHMPGYVGCFLDSGTPPTLSGSSGTSTKLTVQVCLSFCRKRGYKFAGVEAGYACFCGHEGDIRHSQQVSAVECDQVCFGKSSELCGGDGRIGIYNVSMGACQGNFSDLSGVIYSPQFPDDYEANSNCSWILYPAGCDSIELSFRIFDVRDPNDRLEVRDGHSNLLLAQFDGRRRPGAPLLFPTDCLSLFFQSDQFLQAQGFAILYRAWVMYTATGTFILAIIIVSYHLRKRTCLFVQKKTGNSLVPFSFKGPRNRCQCLGGEAWTVAYRHTRVVICTTRGAPHHRPLHTGGGVAGGDDETSSDCSCLCHSYENLSSTNQSSLKSLISTI